MRILKGQVKLGLKNADKAIKENFIDKLLIFA